MWIAGGGRLATSKRRSNYRDEDGRGLNNDRGGEGWDLKVGLSGVLSPGMRRESRYSSMRAALVLSWTRMERETVLGRVVLEMRS
jgi:hypothetical protein